MFIKLEVPATKEYPFGMQVWLDAESIDRIEGDTDWNKRQTTVYLKRNPTEPFLVLKKSLPDVAHVINEGLMSGGVRDLARAVERLVEAFESRRSDE